MRAAFYESDVTPPLGGYMWGHYREKRAAEVHERLTAKAVVVEDAGEVAAIVVIDSCAIPEAMRDIVTARIEEYTGIPAERVCLASIARRSPALPMPLTAMSFTAWWPTRSRLPTAALRRPRSASARV